MNGRGKISGFGGSIRCAFHRFAEPRRRAGTGGQMQKCGGRLGGCSR